jgi:hypothetical protein
MQRKFLVAAAAIAVCAAASAPAFADTFGNLGNIGANVPGTGFVEGDYLNLHTAGTTGTHNGWQALGSYNTSPSANQWGLQADFTYMDGENIPDQYIGGQVTGFRQLTNGRVGLYGAYADSFGDEDWELGGVGQYFGKRYTLTGIAGAGRDTDANIGYWLYGATGSYYFQPNLSFAGLYSYEHDDHGLPSVSVLGAHLEWKPQQSPVSFLVGYTNLNPSGGSAPQESIVNVGVRFTFGSGAKSLQERDQTGTISDYALRQHF